MTVLHLRPTTTALNRAPDWSARIGRVVSGVFVLFFVTTGAAHAQVIKGCVNPSSGEIKIADTCQPHWSAISWTLGAPPASTGGTLVAQHTWSTRTIFACCDWRDIYDSAFTGSTHGGPLLISTSVSISTITGGGITCQPLIDGQWAGAYGSLANTGDPFWKEGMLVPGAASPWTPSRVYPGVPAGSHNFSLQCASSGEAEIIGFDVASFMSVIELK